MAITRENVEYIANLARLDPKGKGFDKIAEDMQGIVSMVDQLQELDLGDITDVIDTERKNAMREDVPAVVDEYGVSVAHALRNLLLKMGSMLTSYQSDQITFFRPFNLRFVTNFWYTIFSAIKYKRPVTQSSACR